MTEAERTQGAKRGLGAALIPIAVIVVSIGTIAGIILLEDDEAGQQPAAVASTPADPGSTFFGGPIVPGEHSVSIFNPPLKLTIGEGWTAYSAPDDDQIILEGPALFAITRVTKVREAGTQNDVDAPDDLIAWYRNHNDFQADEPVSVTVDGHPARQMDMTSLETADTIHFPPYEYLRTQKGDRTRITVIDVDGAQIAAITTVDPELFDAAVAQSQAIVDSINFNPPPAESPV